MVLELMECDLRKYLIGITDLPYVHEFKTQHIILLTLIRLCDSLYEDATKVALQNVSFSFLAWSLHIVSAVISPTEGLLNNCKLCRRTCEC